MIQGTWATSHNNSWYSTEREKPASRKTVVEQFDASFNPGDRHFIVPDVRDNYDISLFTTAKFNLIGINLFA